MALISALNPLLLSPAKTILVHEQGQTPDSLKRSYENAPLGQKWLVSAVFTNCPVWGLIKLVSFLRISNRNIVVL